MPARVGDVLEAIRERRLDHNRSEVLMFAGEGPDLVRRSRVSEVEQRPVLGFDKESNAGDRVIDSDRGHGVVSDFGSFFLRQPAKSKDGKSLARSGEARKIRPQTIVK